MGKCGDIRNVYINHIKPITISSGLLARMVQPWTQQIFFVVFSINHTAQACSQDYLFGFSHWLKRNCAIYSDFLQYHTLANILSKWFERGHCDQRIIYKCEIWNTIVGLWVAHLLELIKLLQSNTSIKMLEIEK